MSSISNETLVCLAFSPKILSVLRMVSFKLKGVVSILNFPDSIFEISKTSLIIDNKVEDAERMMSMK